MQLPRSSAMPAAELYSELQQCAKVEASRGPDKRRPETDLHFRRSMATVLKRTFDLIPVYFTAFQCACVLSQAFFCNVRKRRYRKMYKQNKKCNVIKADLLPRHYV